ncbi:hypothetical protein PSP6_40032 [Paraburkholderia tropica]|nr:hypothetical protein PSP6_40032 [Paraburkholderia tropica]
MPGRSRDENTARATPGNTDTGIATTTQLTVFYRFFWIEAMREAAFAWHNRFTKYCPPQSLTPRISWQRRSTTSCGTRMWSTRKTTARRSFISTVICCTKSPARRLLKA